MLGGPATTVVAGDGPGPDLQKPVPFLLARRTGTAARFAALLEPYGDWPAITAFREVAPDLFEVQGPEWTDTVRLGAQGLDYVRASRTPRRRSGRSVPGARP